MGIRDRLRRLEERMARLDVPSLDEVGAAFGRVTERAWARIRGEPSVPYEDRHTTPCSPKRTPASSGAGTRSSCAVTQTCSPSGARAGSPSRSLREGTRA
jgi:hypothetical protein